MPIPLNHRGAGVVTLAAPTSGNVTLTLPVSDGTSGQALTTNGSGQLAFSGVTTAQAGSAAAPSITTTGDTNTGIFFPAADTIAFSEGGVESMRVDASGNLGIGTTSPAYKLDVLGATTESGRFRTSGSINALYLADSGTTAGTLYIGTVGNDFRVVTGSNERMRIDSNGALLINTTTRYFGENLGVASSTSYTITSTRTGTGNEGHMAFQNANGAVGTIFTNGTTTAYNTSSDYRLKNITGPITTSGAYIDSLNPVEGTWKADGSTFVGLIAHEVQEASRTVVATGTKDGEHMQGMDYSSAELIANLIAEVKALRTRVAALESN
jgi:hypothetical protein